MKALQKLELIIQETGSLICVGLDPDIHSLPDQYKSHATPQFDFNVDIIESTHEYVCAYKPNLAFYEASGVQGMRELEMTMNYLREKHPRIFTICDAKRGDIETTNTQYAHAIFDVLGFDAVTLHPYLGYRSLEPFLERDDKACIILCRTSNPGAGELQDMKIGDLPLWQVIAMKVREWNTLGNCMMVVGATYPNEMKIIRSMVSEMTFLVPGIGAQGGTVRNTVESGQTRLGSGLLISSSRSIIYSDDPGMAAKKLRDEVNQYRVVQKD